MLLKLVALLVLYGTLAVFSRDDLRTTTYAWGLEQKPVKGQCVGVTDADTICVLIPDKQQIRVRILC